MHSNQSHYVARFTATALIYISCSLPSVSAHAEALLLPVPLTATDFPEEGTAQVKLGQLLFYDKILSGNKNISCSTCHHHTHFGTDGLSLGIGEGGTGVGPDRLPGEGATRIKRRVPRNAPSTLEFWSHANRDSFSRWTPVTLR
jgi:cytochrome c peroxidase